MLKGLLVFLLLFNSLGKNLFSYLSCDGHEAWRSFRGDLQSLRAGAFATADALLVEYFTSVDIGNFVAVLTEPQLTRHLQRPQDCVYGVVTALYVRGQELRRQGHVEAAIADWQMALQFLGKELGLDFLESTEWPLRSAQILFALAEAKAIVQSWPEIPMRERWNAVDPFSILVDPFWSNCVQVNPAQKLKERKPNVVLYGYHPVLVEPVSALSEVLQLHWFGVSDRDCAFFKMCNKKSTEKPVPARLRFKIYESDVDLNEVEDAYRIFWEAEMRLGLRADLIICMELRDAFFLWKITEVAMIYYPAIIFMQDEAMNDYSADVLIQQFEELRSQDVLRFGGLQTGTVAMVAQSPYLAASLEYHTGQKLPSVRPLARYVEVKYQPNSSSILVLCARTRLMMSHSCRGLFREGQRMVPRGTLQVRLPPGDQDVVHGFTFEEVSHFRATVLIPWNIAVTTFYELYAMNMPLFVPDALWLARLWPKQMTSYGRSHPNLHQRFRPNNEHPTPYPSLDSLEDDFQTMLYWARRYAFLEMPGVQSFTSIPQLLLKMTDVDFQSISEKMTEETHKASQEVIPFWAALINELVAK
ncbi:unnamed protein product [Durusdinium trenchii]|uniref:Uncharacterized protein n=4 Tax=Durusdinium trenchii TaxID=1381693 RepID=A0ABP0LEP4_9DINO